MKKQLICRFKGKNGSQGFYTWRKIYYRNLLPTNGRTGIYTCGR